MELREYLFQYEITIKQLCEELNISYTHLCSAINGKRKISRDVLMHIETLTGGKVTCAEMSYMARPVKVPEWVARTHKRADAIAQIKAEWKRNKIKQLDMIWEHEKEAYLEKYGLGSRSVAIEIIDDDQQHIG